MYNKKYIFINTLVFFIFAIMGFISIILFSKNFPIDNYNKTEIITNNINFFNILINNFIVSLIAILGVITFRITSIIIIIFNGFYLGLILGASYVTSGNLLYYIKLILPHSIFEIPAIILSASIGFEGFKYFKNISNKKKISGICIIIALLFVAAFIESNISTLLI